MAVPASQLLTEMAQRLKKLEPSAPANVRTVLPFWNGKSWVVFVASKSAFFSEGQFVEALEKLYGLDQGGG